MNIEFFLLQIHPDAEIVWVSAKELAKRWKQSDTDYVESWTGDPNHKWFLSEQALLLAEISVNTVSRPIEIDFLNGRHRTRWLIQQGLKEIPVGLPIHEIEQCKEIGLVTRDFKNQEFVEIDEEAIGQALVKRKKQLMRIMT